MSPLHLIGEWTRGVLVQVPMPVVRVLFIGVPTLLLVWVLTLPRAETQPPGGAASITGNLKIWASLALMIQIVIYALV